MRMSKLLQKTLLGMLLIFVLLAATVSLFSAWNLRRHLTQQFTSKGAAITSSIASSSVDVLLNRDPSTIQATIDQYIDKPGGVAYVFVVDDQGDIIAHTFVPQIPAEIVQIKDLKGSTLR